jgi:hypothetical protein
MRPNRSNALPADYSFDLAEPMRHWTELRHYTTGSVWFRNEIGWEIGKAIDRLLRAYINMKSRLRHPSYWA